MLKHLFLLLLLCTAMPRVTRTYIAEQVPFLNPPSPRFNFWEVRNTGGVITVIRLSQAPPYSDLSTVENIPQTDPPAARFTAWPIPDLEGRISYGWFLINPDGIVTHLEDR